MTTCPVCNFNLLQDQTDNCPQCSSERTCFRVLAKISEKNALDIICSLSKPKHVRRRVVFSAIVFGTWCVPFIGMLIKAYVSGLVSISPTALSLIAEVRNELLKITACWSFIWSAISIILICRTKQVKNKVVGFFLQIFLSACFIFSTHLLTRRPYSIQTDLMMSVKAIGIFSGSLILVTVFTCLVVYSLGKKKGGEK